MSKQPLIDQLDEAISRILRDPVVQPPVDASLTELLGIARDLSELPRPEFKARLRADLERNLSMSTKVATFRSGFRTVTPYLLPPDAELLDFLKNVFGAEQTEYHAAAPDRFHAEVRIGDSMLMVGVGSGRSMPTALQIYVPNADEVYKRALDAGAVSLFPITEDYGDRFAAVKDPAGNEWYISTHLGSHYIPEHLHTITTYFHPAGAARFIDFLKQAFSAEELQRYDSPEGKVLHAKIKIGDSVVGVGEAHDQWQPLPTMMYLYVPDADAVYDQAIRAGGKSIYAPANQSYGDRNGGVEDLWGNQWFVATPI
jgi:PhnB protein